MAFAKACITCGTPTTAGSYCPEHSKRPDYTYAERERRAKVVNEHRRAYGDQCPGWNRYAHAVIPPNKLSADHVVPVNAGGSEAGILRALCVSCNSAKGDRI